MAKSGSRFGWGTLSLPLALAGMAWGFTFRGVCLGDRVLAAVGLPAWSNGSSGVHYTVYYSLIFFLPAFFLGIEFRGDFGAKAGRAVALIFAIVLILSVFGLSLR